MMIFSKFLINRVDIFPILNSIKPATMNMLYVVVRTEYMNLYKCFVCRFHIVKGSDTKHVSRKTKIVTETTNRLLWQFFGHKSCSVKIAASHQIEVESFCCRCKHFSNLGGQKLVLMRQMYKNGCIK